MCSHIVAKDTEERGCTKPSLKKSARGLRFRRQAPHVYVLHCSDYLGAAGTFLKNTGAGSLTEPHWFP